MSLLYQEGYEERGKIFNIDVSASYRWDPDDLFSKYFPYFLNPGLTKVIAERFPELKSYVEKDQFYEFLKERVISHFIVELKRYLHANLAKFDIAFFPLRLEFKIVDFSRATHFTPRERNHCVIGIKAEDIVIDSLVDAYAHDRERRIFINDVLVRGVLATRELHGVRANMIYSTLEHEFTHFFHFCTQLKKYGQKHPDNQHLHHEAVTMLIDCREKSILLYPSREKFKAYLAEIGKWGDGQDNLQLHQYSLYLAFFIGLARLKQTDPVRFAEQYVISNRNKKEKISLPSADFKDLLREENRPLFFKNLPPDIINRLSAEFMRITASEFIDLYAASAKYLGIPTKHHLVMRKGLGRGTVTTRDLVFSS